MLAADGRLVLWEVLAVVGFAVLVGGLLGYAIGRGGGRRLLERPWLAHRVSGPLETAEGFFAAHGWKAVVLARFVPGLKVVIALTAGIVRMRVLAFAAWHAVASVAFTLVFGLTAYVAGAAMIELLELVGLYALLPLALLALVAWVSRRRLAAGARTLRERLGVSAA